MEKSCTDVLKKRLLDATFSLVYMSAFLFSGRATGSMRLVFYSSAGFYGRIFRSGITAKLRV